MPVSKITDKFQTTVPKEVRSKLSIGAEDSLNWQIQDVTAVVTPATGKIFKWRGRIKIGRGSVSRDIDKARKLRGRTSL